MPPEIQEKSAGEMKELLENAKGRISLFLGNGFTMGKGGQFETFGQRKILERIKNKVKIRSLIEKNEENCQNLEEYLKWLGIYPEFIKFFCDTDYLKSCGIGLEASTNPDSFFEEKSAHFDELIGDFKDHIFNFFKKEHPDSFEETDEVENCIDFLSYFHKIFTINYDLLLYWIIQSANKRESKKKFKDGFARSINKENLLGFSRRYNATNVHFLHGAIHLLHNDGFSYKIKREEYNGLGKLTEILSTVRNKSNYHNLKQIKITRMDFFLLESLYNETIFSKEDFGYEVSEFDVDSTGAFRLW